MKSVLDKIDTCVGCTSCMQSCPQKCISFETDPEGFGVPVIDELKCTDCGVCRKACPVSPDNMKKSGNPAYLGGEKDPQAYACWSNDDETRYKSTSGGAFSILAEEILSQSGVVFGAAFDENFVVRHESITELTELDKLRRSKYVQSDINKSFKQVKSLLAEEKKVLFAGTPCQIAGLKAFLGKKYDGLLTCDFACHGVPPPLIWEMYLSYMEEKYQSQIKDISFRDKSNGWLNSNMAINFANGNVYKDSVSNETYMIGFGKSIFTRKCCFQCSFKHNNSCADITLADFWGFDKLNNIDASYSKGVSLVMGNTPKGNSVLLTLNGKMHMEERPYEEAVKYNPRLVSSSLEPKLRAEFFNDVKSGASFDILRRKYMDNSSIGYVLKKKLKTLLGNDMIESLKKFRHR